jgi:hypothetical protein
MTKPSHTPGPWNVKRIFGDPPAITGPAGGLVANVASSGHTRKELEDARLIAAAPEILESLVWILDAVDTEPEMSIYKAHIEKARAAIAKATGEES